MGETEGERQDREDHIMQGKQNATQVLYILHVQLSDVTTVQRQISSNTLQAHV